MLENIRFFKIVEALKEQKELTDYIELAGILKTNKAGVSDIKQGRKKLSIDNIRSMKLSYPQINIDYIVMGEGEMFITPSVSIAPVEVQSQNESSVIDRLFSTLEKKDQRIEELLKENVRLEEKLRLVGGSDFKKFVEDASTKSTLLRTNQDAPSAGAPLKE
jgi:hypothetical protein